MVFRARSINSGCCDWTYGIYGDVLRNNITGLIGEQLTQILAARSEPIRRQYYSNTELSFWNLSLNIAHYVGIARLLI